MSQPSVASFFNTRKRPAGDEITIGKNKVFVAAEQIGGDSQDFDNVRLIFHNNNVDRIDAIKGEQNNLYSGNKISEKNASFQKQIQEEIPSTLSTRSGRIIKRIGSNTNLDVPIIKSSKIEEPAGGKLKQQKLVKFIKQGNLSPKKKLLPKNDRSVGDGNDAVAFANKESNANIDRGFKTPTKQIINTNLQKDDIKNLVKKELNFDEVKTKLTRSAKLQELKASLGRLQELEKVRKLQEQRNNRLKNGEPSSAEKKPSAIALKEFKTIELEVLTSPKKGLKTPTKLPAAPDKNVLMSPKHSVTPKKLLFSPSKDGSPAKLIAPPAYQKFMNLAEEGKPTLQLPYKYRCLVEMFRALESVCAMFFNRKEVITFKKLKPAVQRMLRRNFNVSNLAQIKHLYPEAYNFNQMKMRNFGSTSKLDYFQLIITPNIEGVSAGHLAKIDEDNVVKSAQLNAMNPQVIIERCQKFTNILLDKVRVEHDKFLKSLDPPLVIPRDKVTRWHPEFELEKCPDIEQANLPQPPNIEKFSSAKDILSTARNLFNCATPLERAMERLESKTESEKTEFINSTSLENEKKSSDDPITNMLKGIPKSLLEKIRAKQAAKALDAMTRRPSQDLEATKYSRLPELARHLRNVFITEKKGVLPLEIVIKKIENSYRTCLTPKEIESHLQLIAKQCPKWVAFHEIRKTIYLKLSRDMDLSEQLEILEHTANEKSK